MQESKQVRGRITPLRCKKVRAATGRGTKPQRAARPAGAKERPTPRRGAAGHVPPLLPLLVLAAGHTGAHQVNPCARSRGSPESSALACAFIREGTGTVALRGRSPNCRARRNRAACVCREARPKSLGEEPGGQALRAIRGFMARPATVRCGSVMPGVELAAHADSCVYLWKRY